MMTILIQREKQLEKKLEECYDLLSEVETDLLLASSAVEKRRCQRDIERLKARATQIKSDCEAIRYEIEKEKKLVEEKQKALVAADLDLTPLISGGATDYIPKAPWDRLLPEVKADRYTIIEALDVLIAEVTRFLEELEKNKQNNSNNIPLPNQYERGAGYIYRLGKTQEALSLFDAEVESVLSEAKKLLDKVKNLRKQLNSELNSQASGVSQTPGLTNPSAITVNINLNMGCNDQDKGGGYNINRQDGL